MKANKLFLRAFFMMMLSFFSTVLFAADSNTWVKLTPTGATPIVREEPVAVFDPTTNRMIIHGGMGPYCCARLNDTWVLTNADGSESSSPTWTQLPTANPITRNNHTAAYSISSNRMIVFGGGDGVFDGSSTSFSRVFNEVWILTNANGQGGNSEWIKITTCGTPPAPREIPKAVYDLKNNRLIVFGGIDSSGFFNDTWVLTNADATGTACSTWNKLSPTGILPAPRGDVAVAYDASSNRMIMFGGDAGASSIFNDVWILTNANGLGGSPMWIKLSAAGNLPAPRFFPAVGYDSVANRLIIFGGSNNNVSYGDTWILTNANGVDAITPTWIKLNPQGTLPSARSQLGSAYSPLKNRLIIFAGDRAPSCCSYLNETWVLNLSTAYNLTTQPSINLDFATHYDAKNAQTIELKNTSANPITVSNVVISDAGNYWVNLFTDGKLSCRAKHYTANLKNFIIPANKSCTISIGFSPFDDLTAGKAIPATLTLKTMINGVATDKVINLTGIGRAQVANFYNNNPKLWGQNTWGVSELKAGNAPINTTLVGAATGYGSAKFWYGSVTNPVLQKATASIGNLVVFAQNSVNANGHVGVVIQTTPVVTMLSMNDTGAGLRKWSVRPIDWYPNATATWSPLITGFNATDATRHYGFISWKNTVY